MGNIDALITKAEATIDFGDIRNGIQAIRDASGVLHAIKNSGYFLNNEFSRIMQHKNK